MSIQERTEPSVTQNSSAQTRVEDDLNSLPQAPIRMAAVVGKVPWEKQGGPGDQGPGLEQDLLPLYLT